MHNMHVTQMREAFLCCCSLKCALHCTVMRSTYIARVVTCKSRELSCDAELRSTQPVTQQELCQAGTPERRTWKGLTTSSLVATL